MTGPTSANYVFLPWVRQGAASAIPTPDMSAAQPGAVAVSVRLRLNTADEIERAVRLYGPGDVIGIDPQQVVRTEPPHGATDFEPNYFPAIDFDRPDFPWLFTPARADSSSRLRPWLCLVIVRKQDGVRLRLGSGLPLPVLEIGAPARPAHELPDLGESWAWAHVQISGSPADAASIRAALSGDPALTVSRLVCPRRLDPLTEYLACVVPAFDLGRRAGLGLPIAPADERELRPAWASGADAPPEVALPVYVHWEFRTGTGGDFEALVRQLQPRAARDLPPQLGRRPMDISRPGFAIEPQVAALLDLEGALRVMDVPIAGWPDDARVPFQAALQPILDAPGQVRDDQDDPVLAPPIYGCWLAARHTLRPWPAPPDRPAWLDDLNLDPRRRAVAGLGTQVVQSEQEPLMASAWAQLGEIQRINQIRRQAQLARSVNGVLYTRHFSRFSEAALLSVLAPAQARMAITETVDQRPTAMLLAHKLARSALPVRALSAPLRRISSPRGVISARFRAAEVAAMPIVARLNSTAIVPAERTDADLVSINRASDEHHGTLEAFLRQVLRFERLSAALEAPPSLADFRVLPEGATPRRTLLSFQQGEPQSPDALAFLNAARQHQTYMVQSAFISFLTFPAPQVDLPSTKTQLLQRVDPAATITARVNASLRIAGDGARGDGPDDPLEPILDAPEFPQPMYQALRDLSQEFLLPGLEHVPPNTVTLLATNPAFVESFLVGLNAEMSRELLWRGYPTDQRGTCFRQFWDTSVGDGSRDIEAIDRWAADSQLGDHARAGEQLVLLIRGELLRRYPGAVIYAVAAVAGDEQLALSTAPEHMLPPVFRGTLKPDVTFLGFNLTREAALAEPGWFFVIQQQPTEPRFGLDAADFEHPLPPLSSWNDLSWRHLAVTPQALAALSHASIAATLPEIDRAVWGRSAAHQAYITLQRPVRIAIHARQLLTSGSD